LTLLAPGGFILLEFCMVDIPFPSDPHETVSAIIRFFIRGKLR
jgi:hypothetical protein